MTATGSVLPYDGCVDGAGAGRRRLVVAVAAGLALVGALVVLQLVDDGHDGASSGRVEVKGAAVDRASLSGTVTGAEGWRVAVVVDVAGVRQTTTTGRDGRYRLDDLVAGLGELTWTAEPRSAGTAAPVGRDGILLDGTITGRTPVTLSPGENVLDFAL